MRALAALVLLALASCKPAPDATVGDVTEDWARDPGTQRVIDPARVSALQGIATEACLCTRRKGDNAKDQCWSPFWAEVNEYRHTGVASACAAGSSTIVEFEGGQSVLTEWGYGACSDEERPAKQREYEAREKMQGC